MHKINFLMIRLCWVILFVPIYISSLSTLVLAQSSQAEIQNQGANTIPINFNNKEKNGSDRGRPTKRGGMASRDNCPATDIPLTALIPEQQTGKVIEANPTFWVFIPYAANQISKSEFVLQDEFNHDVHRKNLTITKGEGIAGISLDPKINLEANKDYQWYFKIYCDRDRFSSPVYVRGWIQRVAPPTNREKQLNSTTPSIQRLSFYAKQNIWYSFISELMKLRQENSQNSQWNQYWLQLLRNNGLQYLVNQPTIGNIN